MMWLAMGSIAMYFIALTSALIVKKGEAIYWQDFRFPDVFWLSTVLVLFCSALMHLTVKSYSEARFKRFRVLLGSTLLMGLLFLGAQLLGWKVLTDGGMGFTSNVSGSFIYVISGVHGLHIVGGLLVMFIMWIKAIRSRKDPIFELRNIINPKRKHNLELLASYWHFVDLLWVYLFIFFKFTY
jgi:cytochrome c oxidase subunit 3